MPEIPLNTSGQKPASWSHDTQGGTIHTQSSRCARLGDFLCDATRPDRFTTITAAQLGRVTVWDAIFGDADGPKWNTGICFLKD